MPARPVKVPVSVPAILVHEIGEQFDQVLVVRSLKEVQPPHIAKICGKFICLINEEIPIDETNISNTKIFLWKERIKKKNK